ncbi:hypothetical protein RFI_36177, partial [Reticulomyxa filosa]
CLDACKADTDSSFLSSQLRTCHNSLVDSFKPWIIAWIHFDKDKDYAYGKNCLNVYERILVRPLNEVMELHLSNFQYVLHHRDIHLCIIDQIKIIQTQLNTIDDEELIKDRLNLLQYLCISTETSDRYIWMCACLFCVISVKLNEQQLHNAIEFFMDGLGDKDKDIHESCAFSIAKIALKLNKRQLNKAFEFLMNAFQSGKIAICFLHISITQNIGMMKQMRLNL